MHLPAFIKYNNFSTRCLNGLGIYFIYPVVLPSVYLSPCLYMSPALIWINMVIYQKYF